MVMFRKEENAFIFVIQMYNEMKSGAFLTCLYWVCAKCCIFKLVLKDYRASPVGEMAPHLLNTQKHFFKSIFTILIELYSHSGSESATIKLSDSQVSNNLKLF